MCIFTSVFPNIQEVDLHEENKVMICFLLKLMLRYIWVTSQAASCRSAPDSVIWSNGKTPSSKTGGHTLGGLRAQEMWTVFNSWLHKFSAAEKHHDSGPWFYTGLWRGLWDWECLLIFTLQVYHTPWPSSLWRSHPGHIKLGLPSSNFQKSHYY